MYNAMKKLTTVMVIFAATLSLAAQNTMQFNFTFNHIALSVKDLNASVAYYKKVFQLTEITNRSKIEGIRWLSMDDGKELHLISVVKEPVKVNKGIHLALTTQHFDAFIKRLDQLNIDYWDWSGAPLVVNNRADGVKQIYFKDPDGYWIEINNGYTAATPVEQVKNEVWQLEKNYWQYVKDKDFKNYLSLWDDNFIGYPSTNKVGDKAHITDWITDMYKDHNGMFNYELTQKVVNVFDNIVFVAYDVAYTFTNDKNEVTKLAFKITHTWKKSANSWLIIGGMGANK